MFNEITSHRSLIHEYHRNNPVTLDEIQAAVRGRHKWNTQTKQWEVTYRPTRDYWILMLQTVGERIFAMPVPKVVPTRILAQFEQEEQTMQKIKEGTFSMSAASASLKGKVEGFDRKYMSVRDQERPTYEKPHRLEANVGGHFESLQSASVQLTKPKVKVEKTNPYE